MDNLSKLIDEYYKRKKDVDDDKKIVDRLNARIKEELAKAGIEEFDGENFTVSVTEINTDKLNEEKLMELIHMSCPKEIEKKVIKTKSYLDLDILEDLVYNRVIDVDMVNSCIEHRKPTVRLNIKRRKEE